jgi:ATP-binding cassette subfamily F protein uup
MINYIMNLFAANNLEKSAGGRLLFKDITLGIAAGEKTALIGDNGCGKSTLLKILADVVKADSGEVIKRRGLKVSYLSQIPEFSAGQSVLDYVFSSDTPEMRLLKEYEQCLEETAAGSQQALIKMERLLSEIEHKDLWSLEAKIKAILSELGITDTTAAMETLSGGMAKKVAIAAALSASADLLLLDEPTNHLDIETIKWLEDYLKNTKQAVILVTHDRYFLQNICSSIYEIDDRQIYKYDGNYSDYLYGREVRHHNKAKAAEKLDSILRKEYEWIKRGPRARAGKDKKRSANYHEMVDQKNSNKTTEIKTEFTVKERRLGGKIINVHKVNKKWEDQEIIKDFSYKFSKGEKVGIIGANGCGKSTLLNIIAQRIEPDSGRMEYGVNTHIGYFDQTAEKIPEEKTVLEYIREKALEIQKTGVSTLTPEKLLESFMFETGSYNTPTGKLSGGEKRRLYLIRILLENPNFLILDEPTNDFDLKTLSLIEDFLNTYNGCLLVVSHDRYFIDRTTDYLLIFTESGEIEGYAGSVDSYFEERKQRKPKNNFLPETESNDGKEQYKAQKSRQKKKGLTFNEKRELETIEAEIEALEEEKSELDSLFLKGETNPEILAEKGKRYSEIDDILMERMERWEELENKQIDKEP